MAGGGAVGWRGLAGGGAVGAPCSCSFGCPCSVGEYHGAMTMGAVHIFYAEFSAVIFVFVAALMFINIYIYKLYFELQSARRETFNSTCK